MTTRFSVLAGLLMLPCLAISQTTVHEDFEDGRYVGDATSMQVSPKLITDGGNTFLRITGSSSDRDSLHYCQKTGACPHRNRSTVTFTNDRNDMPTLTAANNRWTYQADLRISHLHPKALEVNPFELHIQGLPNSGSWVCLGRFQTFGAQNSWGRTPGHLYFATGWIDDDVPAGGDYDLGGTTLSAWHQYKIVATFSTNASLGRYEVFLDGTLKKTIRLATHTGCRLKLPVVKFGLYGDYATGIVDVDNIHITAGAGGGTGSLPPEGPPPGIPDDPDPPMVVRLPPPKHVRVE